MQKLGTAFAFNCAPIESATMLKQYYLGCLSHASYMIADSECGIAAVVDPQRDVDQYIADAKDHGCVIRHVFLTHFHADFVAGHIELRDRLDATIYLGAKADAEYKFHPLHDGDMIEICSVRVTALETAAYKPKGISLLVERTRDDQTLVPPPTAQDRCADNSGRPTRFDNRLTEAVELPEVLQFARASL